MPLVTASEKEDAALSLTMAVVRSSNGPLLLLNEELHVVVASHSFCRSFAVDPETVVGASIFDLGGGEWNVPQLRSLLTVTAAGSPPPEAYEFELQRAGGKPRCLSVHAQRLTYLDLDEVRLLVAVTDITSARADARARELLTRENGLLLQEVRHRIANSLQIIASVLLQGARKSLSEETRSHLQNAHHRVMSVAALERQLSASISDEGDVGAYLSNLCGSIGDSMIQEPQRVTIQVVADNPALPANVLVSLGLITTELVINALKYAFPDGRRGKITVAYEAPGPSWTLRVTDDGVGMGGTPASTGLGTSIVDALARQLGARVQVADARPGVAVAITHRPQGDQPRLETDASAGSQPAPEPAPNIAY
jgi:two-component sensor histidine kinase